MSLAIIIALVVFIYVGMYGYIYYNKKTEDVML